MTRLLVSLFFLLGYSSLAPAAATFKDPLMVASDPSITGKLALGYCLPYAIALGDDLLQRSGIYSQGITVSLLNPVTHKPLGSHIFVSYLDRQGQRWVVDNNRLRPTRAFSNNPLDWAVTVLHRPEMTTADIHIMFITDLPASKPQDKARFRKWLAWCDTPNFRETIVRQQQDQRQLSKMRR